MGYDEQQTIHDQQGKVMGHEWSEPCRPSTSVEWLDLSDDAELVNGFLDRSVAIKEATNWVNNLLHDEPNWPYASMNNDELVDVFGDLCRAYIDLVQFLAMRLGIESQEDDWPRVLYGTENA